ncbi:MAG: glutamate racemase [Oscillospiraceae bacterium]|nr:glutamate racemase [Oscillospiraceae bacterium]MBQ7143752.1 glutamate racemase [Oscillospiraceae bacterium]
MDDRPIGIFDSGLGGLTAVRTLERLLPGEDLIYFGDSANAPYGTRPLPELRALALGNAGLLAGEGAKAVLVACGTVSSNAMDTLRERYELPFFDVLEAPCREALRVSEGGRIAVAATEATIRSGAFERRLHESAGEWGVEVFAKACQSLVQTVERGHFQPDDPEAVRAVELEMEPIRAFAPDTLLLACTHFPLLEDAIRAYLGPEVRLISVGDAAAAALRDALERRGMRSERKTGTRRFYTSGDPEAFAANAARFLGHPITAERRGNGVTLPPEQRSII